MSIFNYRWRPDITRELDSDTTIDLTHPNLLRQTVYRIFNKSETNIRIFFDGGRFSGIEYLCNDNDATTDENNVTDFILPPRTSKAFMLNSYSECLQIKD